MRKLNKALNKGFTLVELMIVIAIISIIAAIAVPAYSNHVLKTKLTAAMSTVNKYKWMIASFINEAGVTTEADLQDFNVNFKENYLGDSEGDIMSNTGTLANGQTEQSQNLGDPASQAYSNYSNNNGTLVFDDVINGDTYQFAITPRIDETNNLLVWECNISNLTTGNSIPAAAIPDNCNLAFGDQHSDRVNYEQNAQTLLNDRETAYSQALSDWQDRTRTAAEADTNYTNKLGEMDIAAEEAYTANIDRQKLETAERFDGIANGYQTQIDNLDPDSSDYDSEKLRLEGLRDDAIEDAGFQRRTLSGDSSNYYLKDESGNIIKDENDNPLVTSEGAQKYFDTKNSEYQTARSEANTIYETHQAEQRNTADADYDTEFDDATSRYTRDITELNGQQEGDYTTDESVNPDGTKYSSSFAPNNMYVIDYHQNQLALGN